MVGTAVVDKRQKSTPVSFLLSERSSPFHVDRFSVRTIKDYRDRGPHDASLSTLIGYILLILRTHPKIRKAIRRR